MENNDASVATSHLPDIPIYASDIEMSRRPYITNTCAFNIAVTKFSLLHIRNVFHIYMVNCVSEVYIVEIQYIHYALIAVNLSHSLPHILSKPINLWSCRSWVLLGRIHFRYRCEIQCTYTEMVNLFVHIKGQKITYFFFHDTILHQILLSNTALLRTVEQAGSEVMYRTCIWKVHGLNLGKVTCCPDWSSSSLISVPLGNCWNTSLKLTMKTFSPVLSC
jgi:hypothetical protein